MPESGLATKSPSAGAVIGDDPVFSKTLLPSPSWRPGSALGQYEGEGVWAAERYRWKYGKTMMTVQSVDAGSPSHLKVNGLKEQDAVIITGTIDPHSTPERPKNIESIALSNLFKAKP